MVNKASEIQRLALLVERIHDLRREFEPMPEATMDGLFDITEELAAHVMGLQPAGISDWNAKLRLVSAVSGNDEWFDGKTPARLNRTIADLRHLMDNQFQGAAR